MEKKEVESIWTIDSAEANNFTSEICSFTFENSKIFSFCYLAEIEF